MPKKSLVLGLVGAVLLIVATTFMGSYAPRADAQQVLPGGKAAHIRSYIANVPAGGGPHTFMTDSGMGVNGTIITDILLSFDTGGAHTVDIAGLQIRIDIPTEGASDFESVSYHFNSGMSFPTGADITVEKTFGSGSISVLLSGYVY